MKVLIFAGGNGTRLWPVSRTATPKQFQKLVGEKSLFEMTIDRIRKRYSYEDIYVVVPLIYKQTVKKLCPNLPIKNIIIEPYKWDTFACIGYAAFSLYTQFPHETLFMVWSDHVIEQEDHFMDIIDAGSTYAKKHDVLVKIGAKTTYPETNWGYIKYGKQIDEIGNIGIFSFEGHFEKPDYQTAKKFVESYEYLWNTGYMIWPMELLINSYKTYSPKAYKILRTITDIQFSGDIEKEYKRLPKNSIDYEILEHMKKSECVVIPADVGWNDVGDWASLKNQLEQTEEDIVLSGKAKNHISLESKNIIMYSQDQKKFICLIGLDDIAVIDTKDVLLICSKKKSRDVKKIVEQLAEMHPELL
jgi:mannose-1-phosphate guanylyltransferase